LYGGYGYRTTATENYRINTNNRKGLEMAKVTNMRILQDFDKLTRWSEELNLDLSNSDVAITVGNGYHHWDSDTVDGALSFVLGYAAGKGIILNND
jgi:hypothetical protein